MKVVALFAVALLCASASSFGAVSYDAPTFTLTYGAPSDLDSVIDPPGLSDVVAEYGMTKTAFQALNPQVVGFNNAPASGTDTPKTLVAQYSLANTVTFNFAANYNWGGITSHNRTAFSGIAANDCLSTVETQPLNAWFDATIVATGGQGVSALAFCAQPGQDEGRYNGPGQAIFTLSDASTVAIDYPKTGGGEVGVPINMFIGYQAPAGLTITAVRCTRPGAGNSYVAFDDLSFVMTPEPVTLALLALGGLAALRRRQA
jgi:hypothetical protein